MQRSSLALALALAALPAAASAQVMPPQGGPGGGGPPPEMREKMAQIRADARTSSFGALGADHRSRVQDIVDRFDAGTIADPKDAAAQIDAVLTPDEAKTELAQRAKMRDAMRAMFADGGGMGGGDRPGGERRSPDAGRYLLGLAADPQKLRDAMRPGER